MLDDTLREHPSVQCCYTLAAAAAAAATRASLIMIKYLLMWLVINGAESLENCKVGVRFLSPDHQNLDTYVRYINYKCEQSPLALIESLKKSVKDPYVSFYMVNSKRSLPEYGSGDGEDYDDDDDEDVMPSNHVYVSLPTPVLSIVEPTVVSSSAFTPVFIAPTSSYEFIGSGDGPTSILTTPVFNPEYREVTTTLDEVVRVVSNPIPKQVLYAGVYSNVSINRRVFTPACGHHAIVNPEPWVQMHENLIEFFPTIDVVSDYKFIVTCLHGNGNAELYVSVRQRQKSRNYNHSFKIQFGYSRFNQSVIDSLKTIVGELRKLGGGDLVVVGHELESYPYKLTFVNESLISNVCPVEEFTNVYKALGEVSGGGIEVESVAFDVPADNNQCDAGVVKLVSGSRSSVVVGENYPPTIKNQIDKINGVVGRYLTYPVSGDFCYDPEDGGTRNLNVELKNHVLNPVPPDFWLQFDDKNQEFFGLPLSVQHLELVLVCSDKQGKSANDVLEMEIMDTETDEFSTEFSLHFESIPFTPQNLRKFVDKLTSVLSSDMIVHEYSENHGHVLFKWYNTTNPATEQQVTEIRKILLSDDGPVSKALFEQFTPEFNVTVASVIPLKKLMSDNNPVFVDNVNTRVFDFDDHVEGHGGSENVVIHTYTAYLTTYIIPSVLIAIMILLALVIACLLSRKNKYTQASTEEETNVLGSQAYKNSKKSVPVIFQDELDEKNAQSNLYVANPCSVQRAPSYDTQERLPQPREVTPQPPDYQNSLRSMRRTPNRGAIDSYAPPPGISYYGIHNSTSSGGFAGKMPPPPYVPP